MAGTFYDYQPGQIESRFSHDTEFDYINLDIRMVGSITTTTACDDYGHFAGPEHHQAEPLEFSVYFSSVFCPFWNFFRFLEAVTIEVQECAFEWDPEGPTGRMHWHRRFVNDTGFLTIEWVSKESFRHRTMLNTRQAVRSLYEAFRAFVTSEDYDPLRYEEEVSNGEGFQLVISDATLNDLTQVLVPLNSTEAHSVITRLRETTGARKMKGPKLSFPLPYYFEEGWSELPLSEWDTWLSTEWDSLNQEQRIADLQELFVSGCLGWHGANLREMRSTIVEEWLSKPEPPPRRSFKIPGNAQNVFNDRA
jgi:hypothetical protein